MFPSTYLVFDLWRPNVNFKPRAYRTKRGMVLNYSGPGGGVFWAGESVRNMELQLFTLEICRHDQISFPAIGGLDGGLAI